MQPTRQDLALAGDQSWWNVMRQQAEMMVKSGFLPPAVNTPEKVITIALTGRELGIGMMEAVRGINVIQGKPSVSPQLMLALARRTGELANLEMKTGATGATVTITRKGQTPYTTTFGPGEALALGLSGKDNYKKQASTMYQWRALAANLRVTFPDAISGLYTPDEMGATVNVTAEGDMQVVDEGPKTQDRPQIAQEAVSTPETSPNPEVTEWLAEPPQNPTQAEAEVVSANPEPEPEPPAPDKPRGYGKLVTEKQRKLLFHAVTEAGLTTDEAKNLIWKLTKKAHTTELTNEDLTKVLLELGALKAAKGKMAKGGSDE